MVLVLIFDFVCCGTSETVGYPRPCLANYLVELLQSLVNLAIQLTVRGMSNSRLSIGPSTAPAYTWPICVPQTFVK